MHKVFDAMGQPRNFDRRAEDGEHQQMEKDGQDNGSLWEERQGEEKKRRAEEAEQWVGATEWVWWTDGEAAFIVADNLFFRNWEGSTFWTRQSELFITVSKETPAAVLLMMLTFTATIA